MSITASNDSDYSEIKFNSTRTDHCERVKNYNEPKDKARHVKVRSRKRRKCYV